MVSQANSVRFGTSGGPSGTRRPEQLLCASLRYLLLNLPTLEMDSNTNRRLVRHRDCITLVQHHKTIPQARMYQFTRNT
jgi:hypothetical protein